MIGQEGSAGLKWACMGYQGRIEQPIVLTSEEDTYGAGAYMHLKRLPGVPEADRVGHAQVERRNLLVVPHSS